MKVKSVTLETDKGDEVTMSFDEVEDFMKAMRRLKKSCAEPKPERDEPTELQQLQVEILRLQAEEARRQMQPQQIPQWPQQPIITYGPTTVDTVGQLIGTTVVQNDMGMLVGSQSA